MIDVKTLKELRDRSGAGLQDCKNSLEMFRGDMEKAFEHLRNAGMINLSSRDERENNEGIVFQALAGKKAVMIHLACETDFAANSGQFREAGEKMVNICLDVDSREESEKQCLGAVTELKLLLHENLELKGLVIFCARDDEKLFMYSHHTQKAGSLIKFSHSGTENSEIEDFILDLALHVAAQKPRYISEDRISRDEYEKLADECSLDFKKLGKPDKMRQKITEGMVRKKLRQLVLFNQAYIKDENVSVRDYIDNFRQKTGITVRIIDAAWLSVT